MPNRILKDCLLTSDRVSNLSDGAFRLYVSLILIADDYGRLDGRATVIRSLTNPTREDITSKQIQKWIDEIEGEELIAKYKHGDKSFVLIRKWEKHQQIRAKRSKFPPPCSICKNLSRADCDCNNPQHIEVSCGKLRKPEIICNQMIADDSKCNQMKSTEIICARESESESESESELESESENENEHTQLAVSKHVHAHSFAETGTTAPEPPTAIKNTNLDVLLPDKFDEFWESCPRKVEKRRAIKCWNSRIKEKEDPDEIILGTKNYAKTCSKDPQYQKHPATLIGAGKGYKDYLIVNAPHGGNGGSNPPKFYNLEAFDAWNEAHPEGVK